MKITVNDLDKNRKFWIYDDLIDGKGIRLFRQFIEKVLIRFKYESLRYFRVTNDISFTYKEKQLHSVLFPAVHASSDAILFEQPVSRSGKHVHKVVKKNKKNKYSGWVDYWAVYKKNTFVIEVKHSNLSWTGDIVNGKTWDKWFDGKNQVNSVKKNDAGVFDMGNYFFKCLFHVVPIKFKSDSDSKQEKNQINLTNSAKKRFTQVITELKPNYAALWVLPEKMRDPDINDDAYYCLMFFVYVRSV